ncbi:hypothetical protein [Streptomyces pactum]|uniref:hypothetical protein n=1 Tax=Streptomyces pactum TaxID=68249 RepID=UPI003702471D
MRRQRRILTALLLVTVPGAVTACGDSSAADGPADPGRPSAATASPGADRAELARRAAALGTRLDMVYVIDLPGFEPAPQSVGVIGDHGFQSAYVRKAGGTVLLSVDEARGAGAACATPPAGAPAGKGSSAGGSATDRPATPPASAGPAEQCEADGGNWYRATAAEHEYALERDGLVIRLAADRQTVNRATLRRAAGTVHRADDAELARVLPARPGAAQPGERGDLPREGDGAPVDPVDPERAGG